MSLLHSFLPGELASTLLAHFATVSLIASVVALVIWCISLLFSKKIPIGLLKLLWIAALLRFAMFATPPSPTSLMNLSRPAPLAAPAVRELPTPRVAKVIYATKTELAADFPSQKTDKIEPATHGLTWAQLGIVVWFGGSLFFLIRLAAHHFALRQLIRRGSKADEQERSRLDAVATDLRPIGFRLSKPIDRIVVLTEELDSPAVTGLFRPVLLLPKWSLNELDNRQLTQILSHELIHFQQRDPWIMVLGRIIEALHWFNPMAYVVRRKLEAACEFFCDRTVVAIQTRRNKIFDPYQNYGKTILSVATRMSEGQPKPFLAGSFVVPNENLIKQRIAMLLTRKPSKAIFLMCTGLFAALLLCGFTSAQTKQPTEEHKQVRQTNQDLTLERALNSDRPILDDTAIGSSNPVAVKQDRVAQLKPTPTNSIKKPTAEELANRKLSKSYRESLRQAFPDVFPSATVTDKTIELVGKWSEEIKNEIGEWHANQPKWNSRKLEFVSLVAVQFKIYEYVPEEMSKEKQALAKSLNETQLKIFDRATNPYQRYKSLNLSRDDIKHFFEIAEKMGLCQLQDQPILLASNNRHATFFSGFEIPIPIQRQDGKMDVEMRPVGVRIKIVPFKIEDSKYLFEWQVEYSKAAKELPRGEIWGFEVRRVNSSLKWSAAEKNRASSVFVFPPTRFGPDEKVDSPEKSLMVVATPMEIDEVKGVDK